MIPGIVAQITAPSAPVGGTPTLVPGQFASRTGGGTLALPSAPTPGNLIVIIAMFNVTISTNTTIAGFGRSGPYIGPGGGLIISAFSRVAQSGDTGSVNLQGVPVAAIYEFENAVGVARINGGSLDQNFSFPNYSIPVAKSPYGPNDVVIGIGGHLRSSVFDNDPASGLITDVSAAAISIGGCIFRLSDTPPALVTGEIVGDTATSAPSFGLFAILSPDTLE